MGMLVYGSLFAGIGGFDEGFNRAGMQCAWQVEIDDACNRVLERRFPGVPRFRDVRTIERSDVRAVDVLCGGFPCQDVSVAGKRKGLAGERSSLWFEFLRVIRMLHPRWVVVENPPGLLSSNAGRDFATVLRGLVECGYGVCWRILDAQYFGVAQRRRRVFVVGSLGNGGCAQVLFESEGGGWNPPPRRQARQKVAASLTAGSGVTGNAPGRRQVNIVAAALTTDSYADRAGEECNLVASCLEGHPPRYDLETETFIAFQCQGSVDRSLQANKRDAVAVNMAQITSSENRATVKPGQPCPTLDTRGYVDVFGPGVMGVRRLTPRECERLQGFPDDWTAGESDTARYRMLGNAVCVYQALWIGRRIVEVDRG